MFQKFINGYEGMCMNGGNFLKEWQVTDKITEWIFFQFTFNLLQMTQTQEIINHRVFKNSWMDIRGCVWVGESFLRNVKWQKIIEWIFSQFTFNLLQMTQTQKIITHSVSKIHKWIWGDVYEWGKLS